jgi:hypothetical protein
MKYVLQIVAAVILIIAGQYIVKGELSPNLTAEGLVIIISLLVTEIGYDVYRNWRRCKLVIQCFWLSLSGKYIRFSMAYQYRIRIRDKYLLVKNSNWNFYQLVGGKYKRLPVTQKILQDFEATDDLKLPTHGLKKDDMAVFIPAKNAIKFIDWFCTGKEREVSHWREFYEELIEGKATILSQKTFPYVNYNYVKTLRTPLKRAKAPGWNCWEILQYDILDILPTKEQEKELEELFSKGDSNYIKWADTELINNLGFNNHDRSTNYKIAEHAKWVVNLKYSKE